MTAAQTASLAPVRNRAPEGPTSRLSPFPCKNPDETILRNP
jgi:hypothetical protein